MAAKALLVFCASALFIQVISGQCIGNGFNSGYFNNGYGNGLVGSGSGLGYSGLGTSLAYSGLSCSNGLGNIGNFASAGVNSAACGGALGVSSGSPIYPSGLAVQSENAIGGNLDVAGLLPFVSAVAVEGQVPSAGSAGVQYSCGNGNVGIQSAGPVGLGYGSDIGSGLGFGAGFGSVSNGIGFGNALSGVGNSCGCNAY